MMMIYSDEMKKNVESGVIKNRLEAAQAYANVIRISDLAEVSVAELNAAIVKRWSKAGLDYIKKEAWRIVEPRRS